MFYRTNTYQVGTYYRTVSRTYRHNFLIVKQCNRYYDYEYSNEPITMQLNIA